MFITTTISKLENEQVAEVNDFMASFLPRIKEQSGVQAVYRYFRPDRQDEVTIIIWNDPSALQKYRESSLFKEAVNFEKENQISSVREIKP
jgi:heme-degrading monooxygenase HmoA